MMSDKVTKVLDSIERVKAEIKLKDVLISELYLQHIQERQEIKKEFFVQRRLMEQKHEEETVRSANTLLFCFISLPIFLELKVIFSKSKLKWTAWRNN